LTRGQARKDVDEEILNALGARKFAPRELRKVISKDISRATYFRHKKKLLEQRKMEELKLLGEDGNYHKFLQAISPGLMAYQQDIELYLDQMENPIPEICERGYKFFEKLCNLKRVAWYFSPKLSPNPNFKSKKDERIFSERSLCGKVVLRCTS